MSGLLRRKPKQAPSETYAARVARGRVPLSLSVSTEAAEALAELAARTGETKSGVVERLVLDATSGFRVRLATRTKTVRTRTETGRRRPKAGA